MWTRTQYRALVAALVVMMQVTLAGAQDGREDDPELASYRERFKSGLDRYEANDVAGALSFWEPLYHDLGPARGFRVGYNLARAYEVFGDATRAAERYQSFLDEVKQRRKDAKPVDDVVTTDEQKATTRLEELVRTRARIRVTPAMPPESVRIDQSEPRLAGFVAYVAPGAHVVVFGPGSPREHTERVEVQAGQVVELTAPVEPKVDVVPPLHDVTKHPFSQTWLWVGVGATVLVGGGLTATAYANAIVLHDRSMPAPTAKEVSDYSGARTLAYASWAAPATLALVTVALAVWYAAAAKHVKMPLTMGLAF